MTANVLKEFVQPSFALTETATLSLLNVAVDKASELEIKATVTVVDQSGRLLAFVRMAGSFLISSELSQKKACTAAGMGVESVKLESMLKTAEPRILEGLTKAGEFTVIGGGVPLFWGGVLIGGIGVSGGSEEQDVVCAHAGAYQLSVLEGAA